jgi:hypothetical protein
METRKFNFINGQFNPLEAQEILLDLHHKNINFNKIKNFSSQVRFGEDDTKALNQIEILKENSVHIATIVKEAKALNKNLVIHSFIEIEYED